mmetsp:Transcript_50715/g.123627  ORF Transcript_50715/g.123627 Transcript_50715/m.123627 type:complete len:269 (+) Transcript_50715:110-916(+)
MALKVAVVTGANKGIGYEIARNLGSMPGQLAILACRNPKLGEESAARLKSEGCNVQFMPLDIDSEQSIDEFAAKLKISFPQGIDILVNNAAIAFKGADPTPFGQQAEPTIRVNYKGTAMLTDALLPVVKNGGRIATVASMSGSLRNYHPSLQERFRNPNMTRQQLDQLAGEFVTLAQRGQHNQAGWPNTCYGVSKALAIAHTRMLARELAPRGILVNCCCPGYVATDMSSHRGHKTPAQGADTPTFIALLPDGGPTGQFWSDRTIQPW